MENLLLKEKELELTKQAMFEKEEEHRKQFEEQRRNFLEKENELESQRKVNEQVETFTKQIKPDIDEANEIAKQLNQDV